MNENIKNRLMDHFIMADFMACNKWLPLDPRRQAMFDYQSNPVVRDRVNGIVGSILEIVEDDNGGLHTEKN